MSEDDTTADGPREDDRREDDTRDADTPPEGRVAAGSDADRRGVRRGVPDPGAPRAGVGRGRRAGAARRRARGVAVGLALVGAAWAAAGESYPTSDDPAVLELEAAWLDSVGEPAVRMCTGDATFRRTEETRDPLDTTAALGVWTPLSAYETGTGTRCVTKDGVTSIVHDGGGDLATVGQDGYFMYRFSAVGACVFLRLILEAEDAATETWRIRFHGQEVADVKNGPAVRATTLTIRNDYLVTWNRRVVNTDGVAGEFDEDKAIAQDFAVRLRLVDGSEVREGAKLVFTAPATVKTQRSVGPKVEAKADGSGVSAGASLGITWGGEKTYTNFIELDRDAREKTLSGAVSVVRALPCPANEVATVDTWFDGDFWVLDQESFNGSFGARQELTLCVVNVISSIDATGCIDCAVVPPPPTQPPPVRPPVTTPSDPPPALSTPTTPSDPAPTSPGATAPVGPLLPSAPSAPWEPSDPTGPLVPLAPAETPRSEGEPLPDDVCPYPYEGGDGTPGDVPDGPDPWDPLGRTEPLGGATATSTPGDGLP